MGDTVPKDCPVRDILRQIAGMIALLDKILEHCRECPHFGKGESHE